MYIFWFNNDKMDCYSARVIKKNKTKHMRSTNREMIFVKIDTDSELAERHNEHREFYEVPLKEGSVYRRMFWLKNNDAEKAKKIVLDYKLEQINNYAKKISKMIGESE